MTSGHRAPTALRLNGEKVYMAARSCSRDRPRLVTPSYRCTRLQKMGCTMGIQVPVFSLPTPPTGTHRYHMLLSPRCQTEAYQSQCKGRPISFIIHHHHFPKDSMRLSEILAGAGRGLLTLKPTLPLSATDYKCFQNIQSRGTLYKAEEIMIQLQHMKHLRST